MEREGRSIRVACSEQVEKDDYIVEWLDQQTVRDKLDMPREPSSLRIWITQEDLWVYHTLLQIIANTNEAAGADRYSNAAVRVIWSLEVGRPAAIASRGSGRILMLAPSSKGGSDEGMDRDATASTDGGMDDFRGGGDGALTEEQEAAMLLSARYLDARGNPTSKPGAEYKRLPVRMTLLMDQRWLTHLIAECASAPLQVEVQEVRINPTEMGSSDGRFDRRSGGIGGGSTSRSRDGRSDAMTFPQEPNIVPVIIQGVIYIFNEPNESLLQVDETQV